MTKRIIERHVADYERRSRKNTYGQKGGTGPTAGKNASTYEFTLPDGVKATKRCFDIHTDAAQACCYEHGGKWYAGGIIEQGAEPYSRQTAVPATKVS